MESDLQEAARMNAKERYNLWVNDARLDEGSKQELMAIANDEKQLRIDSTGIWNSAPVVCKATTCQKLACGTYV